MRYGLSFRDLKVELSKRGRHPEFATFSHAVAHSAETSQRLLPTEHWVSVGRRKICIFEVRVTLGLRRRTALHLEWPKLLAFLPSYAPDEISIAKLDHM